MFLSSRVPMNTSDEHLRTFAAVCVVSPRDNEIETGIFLKGVAGAVEFACTTGWASERPGFIPLSAYVRGDDRPQRCKTGWMIGQARQVRASAQPTSPLRLTRPRHERPAPHLFRSMAVAIGSGSLVRSSAPNGCWPHPQLPV